MSVAIDLLLAIALVWLATQAVSGTSLFRSIIMFIVFGLFMALAWARLHAPDLALAEAAIGAGLTGALLLGAYRQIYEQVPARKPPTLRARSRLVLPVSVLAGALFAAVGIGALTMQLEPAAAGILARAALADTGLANPVTAVLLVFRGWDTLLEMAVLLTAFAGARAVAVDTAPGSGGHDTPLVGALLSVIVPLTVLTAVYLLRTGGHAPGGAFQAGAVLAAGGVLLLLAGRVQATRYTHLGTRFLLIIGIATFIALGIGGTPMALPGTWAIYAVEAALMVSIAVALVLLFAGAESLRRPDR